MFHAFLAAFVGPPTCARLCLHFSYKTLVLWYTFWLVADIAGFIQLMPPLCYHKNPANTAMGEDGTNWIITLGWRKYYDHLLYPILEDWYFNKIGIGKVNKETDARYAKRQQESMNWASYSSENNTKFAGRVTIECSIYSHITTFDVTNYAMHFSKNPISICSFVESCHVVTSIVLFSSLP